MTKKDFNQNAKFEQELISSFEPDFDFSEKPLNRINSTQNHNAHGILDKAEQLSELKKRINSIENCNLKSNSKNLILGDGNVNSPIMLIGETPGEAEEVVGLPFQGEVGKLLSKMLMAINLKREKIYITYSINFRCPEDRKPTSQEIKRYSIFLKKHISIINPKIVVLMGSTAMEAVTGLNNKISSERGNGKKQY